ncbi:WASH complex subunit 4-like isoform X2 [Varroa jacobsoni]|uniref:Uncharacterized protein n=1 Tax=Varroa destructor TaxID=109461 RepID=A0A7M7K912_VARDE|nr:WASH complex subunit 4-like isoform X2 [Varroa destructor]XP_022687630.1 WASH complex subunit 4-like isoform X2 [Varroa jacobsoni]
MDLEDHSEVCQVLMQHELRRFASVVRNHIIKLENLMPEERRQYSNSTLHVGRISQKPADGVCPVFLIKTGSPNFNKVALSIASICLELETLVQENDFARLLHSYGEGEGSADSPEQQLARFLPVLKRMKAYISRCEDAIQLAVNQIAGFFSFAPQNDAFTMQVVFDVMSRLLISLVTLDLAVLHQGVLHDHFAAYMRLLKSVRYAEQKLDDQIKALLKLLGDIDQQLLRGGILRWCLTQISGSSGRMLESLKTVLRSDLSQLEAKLAENPMQVYRHSPSFVGSCALFLLHFTLTKQADRRLFRSICDVAKKVGPVHLTGNVVWTAYEFFLREIPALGKLVPTLDKTNHLEQMLSKLAQDVVGYENQVALWLLKLDVTMGNPADSEQVVDELKGRCTLLLQAYNMTRCLSQQLQLVVGLHLATAKAMARQSAIFIARMLAALTAIQSAVVRYQMRVNETVAQVEQYLRYQLLHTTVTMKKRFAVEKKNTDKKLDANAAIKLLETCLRGPLTQIKEFCLQLALEYVIQVKAIHQHEVAPFNATLDKLRVLSNFSSQLCKAGDLWGLAAHHGILLEVFLSQMYQNNSSVTSDSLPRVVEAIAGDCDIQMEESLRQVLDEYLVEQLCKDIETDLRLQMHSHLVTDTRNPFQLTRPQPHTQFKRLLQLESITLPSEKLWLKRSVETYLERMFYNLTTVALHDWRAYDEMRAIAQLKFGAETIESHLPAETLDQGPDVLTVMRNIQGFVSRFVYNMNTQTFVERASTSKHLQTINIGHVANSIRTHGPGITDTTVNIVYRYLKVQFTALSQFLFDEQIKSRLLSDIAHFRDHKDALQQKYPFDRAEKICKSIRELGVTSEGHTRLDVLRHLLTCIGNAMGYVRMLRAGVLEHAARANALLPDGKAATFVELLKKTQWKDSKDVSAAADQVDTTVAGLLNRQGVDGGANNVGRVPDHLRLLVEAFEGPFCENDALLTDDGFAIGVAFTLRLTRQFGDFDGLHWFQAVEEKYRKELSASQAASTGAGDEKLAQTTSLTNKRIDAYRKEFRLLSYLFTSARIFFKIN